MNYSKQTNYTRNYQSLGKEKIHAEASAMYKLKFRDELA